MSTLTHLGKSGEANMVDVGTKDTTQREASAIGHVKMDPDTLKIVLEGNAKKGDVISTARIAGIMAAKKTSDLIPLCHPIGLSKVSVDIIPDETLPGLRVTATAGVSGQTGVEMEALTACSVSCLTIYDMVKAVDRGMEISGIVLTEKKGGKSGHWTREG
ncbi:MAG: cyclic pyranopterin monophosphate synthase MoaC [Rhizobiaceae bacterium]|nr:cyclic pyranopterin monophosphate synthase MoaC [Rhizobiaceae bacterium]